MAPSNPAPSGTRRLSIVMVAVQRVAGMVDGTLCLVSRVGRPDDGLVCDQGTVGVKCLSQQCIENRRGVVDINAQAAMLTGDRKQGTHVFGGGSVCWIVADKQIDNICHSSRVGNLKCEEF